MATEAFLNTKYAKQLLRDADLIETELGQFNARWAGFWDRNADHLGALLICHLVVEHHIDGWLAAANPGMKPVSETRLSFAQKMDLLDNVEATVQWLLPGIRRLNRIRNQFAHNLEAAISDEDLKPIKAIVWPWHSAAGKPCNSGISLIRDFTLMVSGMLNSQAYSIRRYGSGCGLVAYQRWLKNATSVGDDSSE
jgi:hypothetical protein